MCPPTASQTPVENICHLEDRGLRAAQPALSGTCPTEPAVLTGPPGGRAGWTHTESCSLARLSLGCPLEEVISSWAGDESYVDMLIRSNHFSTEQPDRYDDQINPCASMPMAARTLESQSALREPPGEKADSDSQGRSTFLLVPVGKARPCRQMLRAAAQLTLCLPGKTTATLLTNPMQCPPHAPSPEAGSWRSIS